MTGLVAADRLEEPLQVRALCLAAGEQRWVLLHLDASLLCGATAEAIERRMEAHEVPCLVVPSGARTAPALTAAAEDGVYRRAVIELAEAAGWLSAQRLAPAAVGYATATFELQEQAGLATPMLPFVDTITVSADGVRPRVVLAVASLPRLVDVHRGEVRRGPWAVAERVVAAATGEPTVVLGLPATGGQEVAGGEQRTGREQKVAEALGAAMATAAAAPVEPLRPTMRLHRAVCEVDTLPLPDPIDARRAADQAEIGCEDGNPGQRVEATARWQWLERVYKAAGAARTAKVSLPVSRTELGHVSLLGVGADVSEAVALAITEQDESDTALVISGAGGRSAVLLAQSDKASLEGGRELEPLTDLWPVDSRASRDVAAALTLAEAP